MPAFRIKINGQDVNRYVDADSFDRFTSRVEGESMWDFRVDTITFDMDRSYLDAIGVPVYALENLAQKQVQLFYYGAPVFTGAIMDAEYGYDTETLSIEVYSAGRIVSDIVLDEFSSGVAKHPVGTFVLNLFQEVNAQLQDNGFAFTINEAASIDLEDNPIFKSIVSSEIEISFPAYKEPGDKGGNPYNTDTVTMENLYDLRRYNPGWQDGPPGGWENAKAVAIFAVFPASGSGSSFGTRYFAVPVTESGLDPDARYLLEKNSVDNRHGTWNLNSYTHREEMSDSGIISYLKQAYYPDAESFYQNAGLHIADVYYLFAKADGVYKLLKVEEVQDDLFVYQFENATAGEILRDLGIITNARVWIGPDLRLYLQSRTHLSELGIKHPEQLKASIADKSTEFEPPESFFMSNATRDAFRAQISGYLNGKFKKYESAFAREEFEGDGLLNLRAVTVDRDNIKIGTITSVTYTEDMIETESEIKYA